MSASFFSPAVVLRLLRYEPRSIHARSIGRRTSAFGADVPACRHQAPGTRHQAPEDPWGPTSARGRGDGGERAGLHWEKTRAKRLSKVTSLPRLGLKIGVEKLARAERKKMDFPLLLLASS